MERGRSVRVRAATGRHPHDLRVLRARGIVRIGLDDVPPLSCDVLPDELGHPVGGRFLDETDVDGSGRPVGNDRAGVGADERAGEAANVQRGS